MKGKIMKFINFVCVAFWTVVIYVRLTFSICFYGHDDSVADAVIAAIGRREIKRPWDALRIIKAWESSQKQP